jgi:hypothetical protein
MSRTRNQLWPLVLLIVCALIPQLFLSKADPSPDSRWINLMDIWQPDESSSAYRFWLPSPQPLQVTLIKWQGGIHNRIWTIGIESSRDLNPLPAPVRRTEFENGPPFGRAGKVLSERSWVGSTEGLFGDCRPAIWYRRKANNWQFLAYQDIGAVGPGPIEIVPRAKIKLGQECEFGEGYFTWQPGSKWLACDRHGNIEP